QPGRNPRVGVQGSLRRAPGVCLAADRSDVQIRMRYIVCLAAAVALAIPAVASALPGPTANPANKLLSRGIDPIRYDEATRCNGGHIPVGTKAMLAWLERNSNGVNWGEYRCEVWGKHSASLH